MSGTQSTIALDVILGNPYKDAETDNDKNENNNE